MMMMMGKEGEQVRWRDTHCLVASSAATRQLPEEKENETEVLTRWH